MVRAVRLLVELEGKLRKLCSLSSTSDGSIHVFPYSPNNRYFCGSRGLEARELQMTFPFDVDPQVEEVPKVSFHRSGLIHVKRGADEYLAGPVRVPGFDDYRGEHIATVGVDHFGSLPEFEGRPRSTGSRIDHVLRIRPGVWAGRVPVYLNGIEPKFPKADINIRWHVQGETERYVGLAVLANDPLSESGSYVIAGWPPEQQPDQAATILFVRGV